MDENINNNNNIDDAFARLEEIIENMEKRDTSLEESFNLYKEGVLLVKECNDKLDKVEKEISIINSNGEIIESDGTF
jgi:exodeoxyribonuclease VII small subunit